MWFSKELSEITYNAPGSPSLAERDETNFKEPPLIILGELIMGLGQY